MARALENGFFRVVQQGEHPESYKSNQAVGLILSTSTTPGSSYTTEYAVTSATSANRQAQCTKRTDDSQQLRASRLLN